GSFTPPCATCVSTSESHCARGLHVSVGVHSHLSSMDSDMVEIAPPAFAWCSKTLEIHKGFSGDECSPALKRGGCDTLSEGVSVKYKSNLGFDDQPAAKQSLHRLWVAIFKRRSGNLSSYALIQFAIYFLHSHSSYHGSTAAPKTMRTVVAQAAIFLLWRQRNNVLHNQQSIKVISLFRVINQKCVTGF
ncbi:hypothetical protein HID58_054894, partial [Brassica napus]